MNVTVSDAKPDDIYDIRSVRKTTWLSTYPNKKYGITLDDIKSRFVDDNNIEGKKQIEATKKHLENPDLHTFVAKVDEKVVGFVVAKVEEENNRIIAIYVLPLYQGKGVGEKLINTAFNWLNSRKKQDVLVNVVTYNSNAINFYEKCGFVSTGKDVSDPAAKLPSGKIMPEVEMRKKYGE